MGLTLLGYVRQHPLIAGRAYLDVAPVAPAGAFAIVWDKPGAVAERYHGNAALMAANPCVTVYAKAAAGESAADARLRCLGICNALLNAVGRVDTHSDGVTPYTPGSFQVQAPIGPSLDATVAGQFYMTLQFAASYYFSPQEAP